MRNSIKREQSQACLNFAERLRVGELCSGMRKNFRLQAKHKILMTLALLLTAATGAWAQTTYTVAGNNAAMFGSAWDAYYTANDMTKNGDGTYSITYTNVYLDDNVQYKVVKDRDWGEAYPADENRVINIAEAGTYTLTIHFNPTTHEVYETMPGSGSGEEAQTKVTWVTDDFFNTSPDTFTKYDVTVTTTNQARMSNYFYGYGANTFTTTLGNFTKIEIVFMPSSSPLTFSGWNYELIEAVQPFPEDEPNIWEYTSKLTWTGDAESVSIQGLVESIKSITFTIAEPASGPDVIINDTKTEASFQMPQYDATATYTIKRDISVDVTATMGDGTDGVRYRVKKDGNNKFIPADMEMAAVPALFTVNDAIEQKALTQTQDYIVQIYAIDAEGQPTGDPMTFATFTFEPGIYAVKAVAADGSDYAGETALSNTFKLFQGYEVQVAAKEFITYYKDEPLRVEDEAAELYTVSSVNDTQAVLSQKSDAMPSNTPMLVYNNSDETKVILLIPCNEPDLAITVAPEFQGTLTGTTIAASTENVTNYALNGKAFVFVKNDLAIGANKAWLSINNSNARTINLVFDDATKITNTNLTNLTNGDWYDLNGRKLNGMPTKKGVYILNGKKVVVK